MKITIDLLKQYNACKQSIVFLEKNFPNGAEASEIITFPNVPLEFLHFGRQYLDVDQDEVQLYKEVCAIDNDSKHVWYSDHVINSRKLMRSHYINNSSFVRNSSNIDKSNYVYNSKDVKNSTNIASSNNILNSLKILESFDVTCSHDIARSNLITWSSSILNSSVLEDCSFIYQSNNLQDCHFCGFIKNSRHCLFCTHLENEEYCIFNHKVSRVIYEQCKEELLLRLQAEQPNMISIQDNKYTFEERFVLSPRFDNVFNGLSEVFYGWVGTLPNYSDSKFINLFFKDRT